MNHGKTIQTERLLLRPFTEEDAADVLAIMSDEETARKAGFKPLKTLEEAENLICNELCFCFAMTEKGTDKVIGIIQSFSLFKIGRDFPALTGMIGYMMDVEHRGRGYMTEAVKAVTEYLLVEDGCDDVTIKVFVGNEASRKVALKCGYFADHSKYSDTVYNPYGTVESEETFTITREDYDWRKMHAAA